MELFFQAYILPYFQIRRLCTKNNIFSISTPKAADPVGIFCLLKPVLEHFLLTMKGLSELNPILGYGGTNNITRCCLKYFLKILSNNFLCDITIFPSVIFCSWPRLKTYHSFFFLCFLKHPKWWGMGEPKHTKLKLCKSANLLIIL